MKRKPTRTNENKRPFRAWAWSLALVLGLLGATTILVMAQTAWPQNGPSLYIAKTAGEQTVSPGDLLTYTLVVSNSGDITATGVVITDTLPDHATFAHASQDGNLAGNEVQWAGQEVRAGERLTLTLAVTIASPLTDGLSIVNRSYGLTCTQGVTATGQAVTVTAVSTPQLGITKTASADWLPPGAVLTYTLVVSNDGNGPATGVVITDTLPDHATFAHASQDGNLVGNEVQWTDQQVRAGEKLTLTLAVTIASPLTDGIPIVNQSYGLTCTQGVAAAGQPLTVTVRLYHVYLPLVRKSPPPPVCGNVIGNGDFENGDANPAPWTESSAGGWRLIAHMSLIPVHNGEWAAYLGGGNNAHDELCQEIDIPANRLSATATWWWQMKTYQTGSQAVDTIRLEIRQGGSALETLGTMSNLSQPNTWLSNTVSISASGTLDLCFVAETDGSRITDFYVDDVAVQVCAPGE